MTHADRGHPVAPSAWVARFAGLVAAPREAGADESGGVVLDLACGAGRHARLLLERGYRVVAVDRDVSGLGDLAGAAGLDLIEADLERAPWPFGTRRFAGIVVTRYLYRPLLATLIGALAEDGVLIYETFARGNERHGRPRRPEFLLEPGELLEAVRATLHVVAYEHGLVRAGAPSVIQRLCAVKLGPRPPWELDLAP